MLPIAEEAAPAWVPTLAFAIPGAIVLAVLTWALRLRRRAGTVRRAQQRRTPASAVELGSVEEIADPSGYSIEAVLKAMAVRPEDHGPTPDGMPHDEGRMGTMLGLRSRMSASTTVLEPHVHWGEREAGQVFVRIGPDERLEGGTTTRATCESGLLGASRLVDTAEGLTNGGPSSWQSGSPTGRSSRPSRTGGRIADGSRRPSARKLMAGEFQRRSAEPPSDHRARLSRGSGSC